MDDSSVCSNGHLLYMANSGLLGNLRVLCVNRKRILQQLIAALHE